MYLTIHKESLVKDIQQQFSELYPFLKIEFLKKALSEKRSVKGMYATPDEPFKSLSTAIDAGTVSVEENLTVAEVEQQFKKQFAVNLQVYRMSVNVWIETTLTDKWSLKKQNQEGEQMSTPKAAPVKNFLSDENQSGQETE